MRSPAALHYEEVQAAMDGEPNDRTASLLEPVIKPLYSAYAALVKARTRRQPLDLDLPHGHSRRGHVDHKAVLAHAGHRKLQRFSVKF